MKSKYNALSSNTKILLIIGLFVLSFVFGSLTDTESENALTTVMSFLTLIAFVLPIVLIYWNYQLKKETEAKKISEIENAKIKKQEDAKAAIQKELDDYIEKPVIPFSESLVFIACGVDIDDKLDEIDVLIINNGEEVVDEYHSFDNTDDVAYFWDTIDRHLTDNPLLITFKAGDELELLKGLRKKADHFPNEYFSIFFNAKEFIDDLTAKNYTELQTEFGIPQAMYAKHVYYEMLKELVSRGIDLNSNKRKIK